MALTYLTTTAANEVTGGSYIGTATGTVNVPATASFTATYVGSASNYVVFDVDFATHGLLTSWSASPPLTSWQSSAQTTWVASPPF